MDRSKRPTIVEALFSYDIGGGERVAADAALGFARRGYRVLCIGTHGNHGPLRDELEAHGLNCVDMQYTSRPRFTRRFTYSYEFEGFLRRERVAALHMHYGVSLEIAGRAAWRARVPRVVMTEHALHQYIEKPSYLRSTAAVARYAHAITVVDPAQGDFFATRMGVPRERLHYVANGVRIPVAPAPRDFALRRSFGAADADFVVAAIGRLHETKDLPTLIAAIAMAAQACTARRICLWIIGAGPDQQRIENAVITHGIQQRVTFLGARTDVPALLAAIDLVAMSSKTEGLPMALIEAMAHGVPCVATSVGGIPKLFAGGAGILVPAEDPAALAREIASAVLDPDMRARLVAAASTRVRESHDIESSITQYLALLGLPASWPPT